VTQLQLRAIQPQLGSRGGRLSAHSRIQSSRAALRKATRSCLGNLQQWLIGTYHGISKDQLQMYLVEFVFRHNVASEPV
jgi:hypothetical protein